MNSAGRFQRHDASLLFAGDAGPVTVTVCSARIVRVSFGAGAGAPGAEEVSFVGPRAWAPTQLDVADVEPVRDTRRDTGGPGWWLDSEGFVCVRPGGSLPLTVVITRGSSR